jgi:hypothetical protein
MHKMFNLSRVQLPLFNKDGAHPLRNLTQTNTDRAARQQPPRATLLQ